MEQELEILDAPVTDGQPVPGVCEGRMVAYWPNDEDEKDGLCAIGSGGYIVGIITGSWNGRGAPSSSMPCVQLRLIPDLMNVGAKHANAGKSSCMYSTKPARGCWTWIPKA